MANQQERRDAAVYLAAMIQGEGSVMAYWNHTGPRRHHCISARVVIYNTDPLVLDECHRHCQALDVSPYRYAYRQRAGDTRKQMGTIMVNGYKRLAHFLPEVIPFLVGEKRRRAEFLSSLAQDRMTLPKMAPYTSEQLAGITRLSPGRTALESSEANMPRTFRGVNVKIESDPLAKVLGGETVTEYPAVVETA